MYPNFWPNIYGSQRVGAVQVNLTPWTQEMHCSDTLVSVSACHTGDPGLRPARSRRAGPVTYIFIYILFYIAPILYLSPCPWGTLCTSLRSSGQGEQLGVRCLAQGHLSHGIEGGYSPTNNPCWTWDSNPQPSAYKSNSLSIRPWLPNYVIH